MDRYETGARAIVAEIARHLQGDLSVELWTGAVLPLGPRARDDIRIRIASPGAIGALLRSPSLMTLVEVYLAGDIEIVGASPLEALGRWEHLRAVGLARSVDRGRLLRAALPFLMARRPREAAMPFSARVRQVFGRGRDDAAMVQHHYDVSNAFYALFLDPEMQYSAALFASAETSLADAQLAKMDLICRKLALSPDTRLLDIGCGWGGLACHAAQHYGARVHGVTLSHEQLAGARERVRARGLEDRVTLELRDYRDVDEAESYDRIVQIGMFEHVGIDNHDRHFAHVRHLLKPRGLYLHQATTRRATRDLAKFRRRTAYMAVINRYIFPGGELDHIGMTVTNLERHGFEVRDVDTMREHYYRSLKAWSEALYANRAAAVREAGKPAPGCGCCISRCRARGSGAACYAISRRWRKSVRSACRVCRSIAARSTGKCHSGLMHGGCAFAAKDLYRGTPASRLLPRRYAVVRRRLRPRDPRQPP